MGLLNYLGGRGILAPLAKARRGTASRTVESAASLIDDLETDVDNVAKADRRRAREVADGARRFTAPTSTTRWTQRFE